MKYTAWLLLALLFSPPCTAQPVLSLHPLFTEQSAVLLPGAAGEWEVSGFGLSISITRSGDNFYTLEYGSEGDRSKFEAVFVRSGTGYILDLVGILPGNISDGDYKNSFIRSHTFYKVDARKDTLVLSETDFRWFYDHIVLKKEPIRHEWTGNALLLTMSTHELSDFLISMSESKGFFKGPILLVKKNIDTIGNVIKNNSGILAAQESRCRKCMPRFPWNDGWMGGDGDVSVAVNDSQTLFIFSDSYVGKKDQKSRLGPGMQMISNTVAVETCTADRSTDIHYYWRNMYTDHPEPVFTTFTNRYRFWVRDAFMYSGALYAILGKVTDRVNAGPGDAGWDHLGLTMARVSNPTAKPGEWQIDLAPMPDFSKPALMPQSHAIMNGYIYYFVSTNNDNSQHLLRQKLDLLDDPGASYEYYSKRHTWENGINPGDMDTLIHGFRSTTVTYHPEIGKWIMMIDISIIDNKIKIRTADNLTGPWSEERVIYETPEKIPGNAAYSPNNFCYLPRDMPQYCTGSGKSLLISYDINNSNLQEINANAGIYTPKVIRVPLKDKTK